MRTKLYVSLVPFLIFSALQAPLQTGGAVLSSELRSAGAPGTEVTDLTLTQDANFDLSLLLAVADHFPSLKRLTLTGPEQLPTVTSAEANDQWPLRLETAHGIFLGDAGMTMAQLLRYASFLERTAITELARDTGLRPEAVKPVVQLYGDEAHWRQVAGSGTFWGYYSAREQRIHMAHWKTPGAINTILLTHELFHWLAWEEGRVDLPTWLNEGLAYNLSWRIEQRADTWLNPFVRREWLRVANNKEHPVPELATHRDQDQFTITAVSYLLQTHGRDGLVPFFERTRGGEPFETAFAQAFGLTPAEFEAEYHAEVDRHRADRQ